MEKAVKYVREKGVYKITIFNTRLETAINMEIDELITVVSYSLDWQKLFNDEQQQLQRVQRYQAS